jgi:hypothetical protein
MFATFSTVPRFAQWGITTFLFFIAGMLVFAGFVTRHFLLFGTPTPVTLDEVARGQHLDTYVSIQLDQAIELGYRIRYDPSHPEEKSDPKKRFARVFLVPVGEKLLVVQVPLNHKGPTASGLVTEMPRDIQMEVTRMSLEEGMAAFKKQMAAIQQSMHDRKKMPERVPQTPSLTERVLPVYLDGEDNRRLGIILIITSLGFFAGGVITTMIAVRARGKAPQSSKVETASESKRGGDDESQCFLCGGPLTQEERTCRVCQNCRS